MQHGFGGFARGAEWQAPHRRASLMRSPRMPKAFASAAKSGATKRRRDITLVVEKFLPLADHAQKSVVDDGDLDVDFFLHDGRKLAHGHLESAVADDHPYFCVRLGKFHAYGCGQCETHGAEAAGSDQRSRQIVVVILRFPHLVLSNIGDHDGFAASLLSRCR